MRLFKCFVCVLTKIDLTRKSKGFLRFVLSTLPFLLIPLPILLNPLPYLSTLGLGLSPTPKSNTALQTLQSNNFLFKLHTTSIKTLFKNFNFKLFNVAKIKQNRRWRIELLICEVEANAKGSGKVPLDRRLIAKSMKFDDYKSSTGYIAMRSASNKLRLKH